MKVFISWSGDELKPFVHSLSSWLSDMLQSVEPFISPNIAKGARGLDVIAEELQDSNFGILCLTRSNQREPWIHFEAGAISKSGKQLWTLLLDLSHADVPPPLSQFQHTVPTRTDVYQLVVAINKAVGESGGKRLEDAALGRVFEKYWPDFERAMAAIPKPRAKTTQPVRGDRELLEEILSLTRSLHEARSDENDPRRLPPRSRLRVSVTDNDYVTIEGRGPELELVALRASRLGLGVRHVVNADGYVAFNVLVPAGDQGPNQVRKLIASLDDPILTRGAEMWIRQQPSQWSRSESEASEGARRPPLGDPYA